MKLIKILLIVFSTGFGGIAFAAPISISPSDPAPLVMLKNTSSQMLRELEKNLGNLKNNDRLVYDLVYRILVPHFE